MMFATTHSSMHRNGYHQRGRALERFLNETVLAPHQPIPQYKSDDAAFHLSLDIPGIAREHIAITVEGAIVRLASREGSPRKYRTAYELPQEIDPSRCEAKLENGVLTLKLGRKIAADNATEIAIQ